MIQIYITIIGAAFGSTGLWELIRFLITRKDRKQDKDDDKARIQREVNLALLHDRIYYISETALQRGEIYMSELDNLTHLAEPYFELGGNGTGEVLVEEAKKLKKAIGDPLAKAIERRDHGE